MFLRLIIGYIRKRRLLKQVEELQALLDDHPVKEPDPPPQTNNEPARGAEADVILYLDLVDSISVETGGRRYRVTREHVARDWEDDDILRCNSWAGDTFVHPQTFLRFLERSDLRYVRNLDRSWIEQISAARWLKFGCMDDSRTYPSLPIEGDRVSIRCHYLCPKFYLAMLDRRAVLLVEDLVDDKTDELPRVMTVLTDDIRGDPAPTSIRKNGCGQSWILISEPGPAPHPVGEGLFLFPGRRVKGVRVAGQSSGRRQRCNARLPRHERAVHRCIVRRIGCFAGEVQTAGQRLGQHIAGRALTRQRIGVRA